MYTTQYMEDHNAEVIAEVIAQYKRKGICLWNNKSKKETWRYHAFPKPQWFIHGTTIRCGLQILADGKANPSLEGLTRKCFGSFLVRQCCLFVT